MRCFIAIDINEQIRTALADLQDKLRTKANIGRGDVKWVSPNATHLTLKFLGEIRDEQVVEVCNIVKDVAGRHKRFEFEVGQVGSFGGKNPRVLWVGAGYGCAELLTLQQELEEQLDAAGWPREARKFAGHLTLCRIRNPRAGIKLAQMTEDYRDFKLGTTPADSICVYQSQLTPQGPIYTLLGSFDLQ